MARDSGDGEGPGETRVRELSSSENQPADGRFVLTVTRGPDKGTRVEVESSHATRSLLGTSPACEIQLVDPEISRRHAALETVGADLRITDLGSTNRTFVDRVKIAEAYL